MGLIRLHLPAGIVNGTVLTITDLSMHLAPVIFLQMTAAVIVPVYWLEPAPVQGIPGRIIRMQVHSWGGRGVGLIPII